MSSLTALYIEPTASSPLIEFNPQTGVLRIEGNSYPENAVKFYEPLIKWLEDFVANPPNPKMRNFEVVFRYEYLNTASAKMVLEILRYLEQIHENGQEVRALWYYHEDDEEMEWAGLDYKEVVRLPFELISYGDE
ncbi:MAG: DUF1987 domain-containing protein [Bacteroidia bacterium]